jgi:hypothetical protein
VVAKNSIAVGHLQVAADPFDESEEELRPHISWRERWPLFLACLRGQSGIPCRSANLVHVLGSVTVRILTHYPALYLIAHFEGAVLRRQKRNSLLAKSNGRKGFLLAQLVQSFVLDEVLINKLALGVYDNNYVIFSEESLKKEDKTSQGDKEEECEIIKDSDSKNSKDKEPEEEPETKQASEIIDDVNELAEKDNNFETDGLFMTVFVYIYE